MKQVEFVREVVNCSGDMLDLIASMQSLVSIASYYPNHKVTTKHLAILSKCLSKMESSIKETRELGIKNQ